jgi:hypothetical protein
MRLISSSDAIAFLSKVAPRPWVQRMLSWMILDGELAAYFTKAAVRAHTLVLAFTYELEKEAGEASGPRMDAVIRKHFGPEIASHLVGMERDSRVYDDPQGWDVSDEAQIADAGYFLFADEIDWERGMLRVSDLPNSRDRPEYLFPNEELLATDFEMPGFEAEFSGMSFDRHAIEMLVPNADLNTSTVAEIASGGRARATGRPPKWNWEGALAYVVSQAQQPDGLPTGPGSQARLEEMMAAWFVQETGDAPAPSLIRQRASNIVRTLERPIRPEKG